MKTGNVACAEKLREKMMKHGNPARQVRTILRRSHHYFRAVVSSARARGVGGQYFDASRTPE
jgi:hypothetical protein